MLTSDRTVQDGGKLLEDTAAVSALLDRLLHHAFVLPVAPAATATTKFEPGDPSGPRKARPSASPLAAGLLDQLLQSCPSSPPSAGRS
jgi:hypothetical protein